MCEARHSHLHEDTEPGREAVSQGLNSGQPHPTPRNHIGRFPQLLPGASTGTTRDHSRPHHFTDKAGNCLDRATTGPKSHCGGTGAEASQSPVWKWCTCHVTYNTRESRKCGETHGKTAQLACPQVIGKRLREAQFRGKGHQSPLSFFRFTKSTSELRCESVNHFCYL